MDAKRYFSNLARKVGTLKCAKTGRMLPRAFIDVVCQSAAGGALLIPLHCICDYLGPAPLDRLETEHALPNGHERGCLSAPQGLRHPLPSAPGARCPEPHPPCP